MNKLVQQNQQLRSMAKRWGAFLSCWVIIAFVWLWVLPSLSRQPQMQEMIQRHKAAGINAGAMVYTELGAIPAVELEYQNGRPELREFRLNSQ